MAKKKAAVKKQTSFEEALWKTATKLQVSVESSGYKQMIATTYHSWKIVGEGSSRSLCDEQELDTPSTYADIPGYCKSATLDDMRTPGRYVGAAPHKPILMLI